MREAFGQVDQTSQGTLTRHEFRTCLTSRMERLSLQEVQGGWVGGAFCKNSTEKEEIR